MSNEPSVAREPGEAKKSRGGLILVLQVVLTALAFGYLLSKTEVDKLMESFRSMPLWSVPVGVATLLLVLFFGAIRWRLLLAAYGARGSMPILRLFKLQLIGLFYNLMPGAVGGDVIRGLVSRDAFGDRVSAGLAVVLVERVIGLIGLMLLVVFVLALHPIQNLELSPWVFAMGTLACLGALLAIALARRFAHILPRVIAKQLQDLPELSNLHAFGLALLVSIGNQALVGVMGHLAIAPLAPQVQLLDSLALAPLAFAAIFFPLTVAGAGTRDQAMIALYGMLGVPRTHALTASVQILISYLLVSAIGGLLGMLSPLQVNVRAPGMAGNE
ncbi:MAG TPA: lysylphosphatidylglycerol synthase transmembrane domain-containing protein [Polyangiales bacterium]|nr:lysylphosphatidylglycerol synthase transmembrane domain-containing protein [Polyangiales bacterium]